MHASKFINNQLRQNCNIASILLLSAYRQKQMRDGKQGIL